MWWILVAVFSRLFVGNVLAFILFPHFATALFLTLFQSFLLTFASSNCGDMARLPFQFGAVEMKSHRLCGGTINVVDVRQFRAVIMHPNIEVIEQRYQQGCLGE